MLSRRLSLILKRLEAPGFQAFGAAGVVRLPGLSLVLRWAAIHHPICRNEFRGGERRVTWAIN
jgi:hypothetical protein